MPYEIDIEALRREARKAGFLLKPNHKKRMSIELEEENYLKLKEESKRRKVSMNRLLNHLIELM